MSWRFLSRAWRAGELRLLVAALVLAVAAVTAVGFLTDRVRQALARDAAQMMGGDLLVVSDHPLPADWFDEAVRQGIAQAETQVFPSMVLAAGQAQLAEIKAVSPSYPLRGRLTIRQQAVVEKAGQGPAPGSVWLDERLAGLLKVGVGDEVALGQSRLHISAILLQEPDRGINFFSLAPRLLMSLDDLAATGLIGPGARVTYRQLYAGAEDDLAVFRLAMEPQLQRGERMEDPRNGRPEVRSALDKAERFLGLASLLTVIISAAATALATRRYLQRQLDHCALLRCLGMTQGGLLRLQLSQFAWLGLAAGVVGCLLGYLVHFLLVDGLGRLLAVDLPLPGMTPVWMGFAVVCVLLFGFSCPPLLQLSRVPTLRILRRELGPPENRAILAYALGLSLLAGLVVFVAGNWRLGGIAVAGFFLALLFFWLLAWMGVRTLAVWRTGGAGWRQGLANAYRHRASARLHIVVLSVGFMAILLLTAIRGQLLDTWHQTLPLDAPNRFVINIQEDQRQAFGQGLAALGVSAELQPMVRGRLLEISGRPVSASNFPDDERAQRLVEREFNLSWRTDLPQGNAVVAGEWFARGLSGQGEASVEVGLAQSLGIILGDELVFSLSGEAVKLKVKSLRKLDWDSMRVNFFVLAPPGVIDKAPASYITSFFLPPAGQPGLNGLIGSFPNLTVIDVSAVLAQFQEVIDQVSQAVELIFSLTVLAGLLVLQAALLSAFDERRHEFGILRALGAQRRQLQQALLGELLASGALAGLIAAGGALLLGQLLANHVFLMAMAWQWSLIPLATLGSALLSAAVGSWALRSLLATSPLLVLRSAG